MSEGRRPIYAIVCFDVDSTLTTLEGIDVLAEDHPRVAELTRRAMDGEIPIEKVYGERLEIVRPSLRDLERLGREYVRNVFPGMNELVSALRDAGSEVRMVTAGIEQAVLPLALHLGVDPSFVHAVPVKLASDGSYAGYEESAPTARAGGKRTVVRNIRVRNKGRMAFVGDGTTDLETRDVVDRFIAFTGVVERPAVVEGADVVARDVRGLWDELFEEDGK